MKRRLFAILAVLSLLLLVATLAMWGRSGLHSDSVTVTVGGLQRTWYSQWYSLHYQRLANDQAGVSDVGYGHCGLGRFHNPSPLGGFAWSEDGCFYVAVPWLFLSLLAAPVPTAWAAMRVARDGLPRWSRHLPWIAINALAVGGIVADGGIFDVLGVYFAATVIAVPFLLVLSLLSASWRAASAARFRDGECLRCGYDLRARPKRCPECGNVPVGAER